jgi:hypothetical protein
MSNRRSFKKQRRISLEDSKMENIRLSSFWPSQTVHRIYWERYNCPEVYDYDSADDGPECEAIRAILASHTLEEIRDEKLLFFWHLASLAMMH